MMPAGDPADRACLHRIGRERRPVLLIDDFMPEPERLLASAASEGEFRATANDYYPGVRNPTPSHYAADLCASYASLLQQTFAFDPIEPRILLSAFSITTTPPGQLRLIQRVPHFDTSDPQQLAVVHYLCDARHGGTSFYRHRHTGYETISHDRLRGYAELLKRQVMREHVPPPKYMDGDDPLFERMGSFEARFNRALIYPSNLLHSGDIRQLHSGELCVRTARLTANTFLRFTG